MLDLTSELAVLQVVPLAAKTATFNSTGVAVNTLDTGDLDLASLNIIAITGTGTITVQLQGAPDDSTWTNLAVTPLMPATAFPVVSAALTAPSTLAIDPRALSAYIRAAVTVTGSISAFTIEVQLFGRLLQIGFPTGSG
jgi:hypothetical protein